MNMTLDGAAGRISYPSVACDGDLQFMSSDGIIYRYKKHITRGTASTGDHPAASPHARRGHELGLAMGQR